MQDVLSLTSVVLLAGVPLTIVPKPTQAQCHDIDREVSQLIAELDHGLSSVATALQAYSLALNPTIKLPHDEPTTWLGTVSATVFEYPFFWYPLHYYRTGCWTYCEGKWGVILIPLNAIMMTFVLRWRNMLQKILPMPISSTRDEQLHVQSSLPAVGRLVLSKRPFVCSTDKQFSIYNHINMESSPRLNCRLLMKQQLFHCQLSSLCLVLI